MQPGSFCATPRVFSSMTTVQPPKYDESVADSAPPRETASHVDQLHAPPEKETSKNRRTWLWKLLLLAGVGWCGFLLYHFNLLGTKTDATAKVTMRPVPVVGAKVTRGD